MSKRYIVRLSDEERQPLSQITKKGKATAVPGKSFAYDDSSMDSSLTKSARTNHPPSVKAISIQKLWDSKQHSLKNSGVSLWINLHVKNCSIRWPPS
jgi:hypothetical protein